MDPGGLTFKQMQDEVLIFRFKEAQRGSVKYWLNQRYALVWAAAPWPFKLNGTTDLTVTSGSWTGVYTTATDVLRPLNVFNENGDVLEYLDPREFQRFYEGSTESGNAVSYTIIDGLIYLGPKPGSNLTYTVSYERKLSCFNGSNTRTLGLMVNDSDYPIWPGAYHYMLVMGATATGLKLVNDPTWQALEDEFRAMIVVMEQEMLPADRGESIQWGTKGAVSN